MVSGDTDKCTQAFNRELDGEKVLLDLANETKSPLSEQEAVESDEQLVFVRKGTEPGEGALREQRQLREVRDKERAINAALEKV